MGMAIDGDLRFVHGFQQGGLRFRGGAIDFVGQQEIAEDRARLELEDLGLDVVDGYPDHVTRQHVTGELQPMKAAGHRVRQRLGQCSLTNSRHIFNQQVPPREQTHQRKPDHFGLAANR